MNQLTLPIEGSTKTNTPDLSQQSSKQIDTLVADIYNLFDSRRLHPWQPDPVRIQQFGLRLASTMADRASRSDELPSLRLSNLGTPDRKLWFTINRPETAIPLRPEARIKFLIGDLLEELVLFLGEEAGHAVEGRQDELDVSGVVGHRDCVIDGRVVDVKSASSRSFEKFKSGRLADDDPFGYIDQLGGYLSGSQSDPLVTDNNKASFLVVDKTLGKICLDTHERDGTDYEALVAHKRAVLDLPEPPADYCYPDVPDGKSGNQKLNKGCSYCPFKYACRPGLRTFLYSSGPVYLTEVSREPRVPEVTPEGDVIYKDF